MCETMEIAASELFDQETDCKHALTRRCQSAGLVRSSSAVSSKRVMPAKMSRRADAVKHTLDSAPWRIGW